MTTITYKDGVIAYDSQISYGGKISTLDFDKHRIANNGDHYFMCGTIDDYQRFMNRDGNVECSAIFVSADRKVLKMIHCNKDDGYFDALTLNGMAVGTGEDAAMGAMDAGATARQAVKIAKQRDVYTGGKIRTFKI